MTEKTRSRFPKTLRIDGLEIPLKFSRLHSEDAASKRLKVDSKAKKIQETAVEDGHINAIATVLYDALFPLIRYPNVSEGHERLLDILTDIKNTDTSNEQGNRRIKIGLATKQGQLILEQFKFTPDCTELDALDGKAFFDWDTQIMTVKDIKLDWMFPSPATHYELTVGIVAIDFEKFTAVLQPLSYYIFIPEMTASSYQLTPKRTIPIDGISIAIIVGKPYELRNNVLNELSNRDSGCIKVIGVHIVN